jgi:RNA polymerase sigma factor (sigma-70 family)
MSVSSGGDRLPSDRRLIAASLDRPERFEGVFERHAPAIYRYLRRRVGKELAEELTAETFLRAFRSRRRFDRRRESALPWLYGIATNLLRMHRRAEQRRLRAYARAVWNGRDDDIDRLIDSAALRPALAEALASLPHAQREVLLLHAWAELTHEEIALALDISAGTVRSRLHRGRMHVAERIAPSGNKADESMVTTP